MYKHIYLMLVLLGLSASSISDDIPIFLFWYDANQPTNTSISQPLLLKGPEIKFDELRQTNVLGFDNPTDVAVVDSIALDGLSNVSFFAWIRPQSAVGYAKEGRVITRATSVDEEDHYWMLGLGRDGSSLRFRLKTTEGGTATLISNLGEVPLGRWTHVAATYDGSFMRLWVDGRQVKKTRKSGLVVDNNSVKASVGNQFLGQARGFVGSMNNIGVTRTALNKQEIAKLIVQGDEIFNGSETDTDVMNPGPNATKGDLSHGASVVCDDINDVSTRWNEVVSLYSQTISGQYGRVQFGLGGYAAPGSRNQHEIDFDIGLQISEKVIVDFAVPVSLHSLTMGRLKKSEWSGKNELGKVSFFNDSGILMDTVELDPASGLQLSSRESVYRFNLNSVQNVAQISIEAVPYASPSISKTLTNESDFNLQGLEYDLNGQRTSLRGYARPLIASNSVPQSPECEGSDKELTDNNFTSNSFVRNLPMGGKFYGNYEYGFHTGNAQVAFESSRRFRAERSGNIKAIKFNNRTLDDETIQSRCSAGKSDSVWCRCVNANLDKYQCGYTLGNSYSVGNGGAITAEIQTDAGGYPSGEVLGTTGGLFVPLENATSHYPRLPLESSAYIKAGEIYHLVYKNLNPPTNCGLSGLSTSDASRCDKNKGAIGLNGIAFAKNGNGSSFRDPFRGSSAANLVRTGAGRSWDLDEDKLSWYEIEYDDGTWVGDTHVAHGASTNGRHTVGGSVKARQVFTVELADRTVDGIWLNYGHTPQFNGADAELEMLLKSSDGKSLGSTKVNQAVECVGEINCTFWAYGELNTDVLLEQGRTYSVEISSSRAGVFNLSAFFPLSYGAWNSTSRNHWTNAKAEVSLNGGVTWGSWASNFEGRDLPLLFTIAGGPKYLD